MLKELSNKTGKVSAELYYRLALTCEQNGKLEEAARIYKEIINKFTTYKDVIGRYKNIDNRSRKTDFSCIKEALSPET